MHFASVPIRSLIVNADDFGQSTGVNRGIVQAHRNGILTSATLLANGNAFEEAVEIARRTPSLGVGVHLNLVEGRPVCEEFSSLVDVRGELLGKWGFVRRHVTGGLRIDDVKREVEAQIRKVLDAGIQPTHVDGHQHLHVYPPIAKAVADIAKRMGVPAIRLPMDLWRWKDIPRAKFGLLRSLIVNRASRLSRSRLAASGLRRTDWFAGTLLTGAISADWLCDWIPCLRTGVTELMVHPGLAEDESIGRLKKRELDLGALVDPAVMRVVQESCIRLIHFAQLAG